MNDYADALSEARNLLREWRELPTREAQAVDRDDILDTLVAERNLPKRAHRALLEAAQAGAEFYANEAEREESAIAEIDRQLEPLLRQIAELQQKLDALTRQRRGHELRLQALRSHAQDARALSTLPAERVTTPEDAESWLGKLPPVEVPPPAEPFKSMYDA